MKPDFGIIHDGIILTGQKNLDSTQFEMQETHTPYISWKGGAICFLKKKHV